MYIHRVLKPGYNAYIDSDRDDLGTQMDVGILVLEAGERYIVQENEKECAVCLLNGEVTISWSLHGIDAARSTAGASASRSVRCSRRDMFRDEATCLLAPAAARIELTAVSPAELYLQKTFNDVPYEPVLYRPEDIQVQHAGGQGELQGCMERQIKTFFDHDNAPFSNMVLGEVLNYPGKWSSYPPHYHPQPEVYFYRFDRPQGFGAGFANGEVYQVENNGLTVINHGFHSQVAAPGYAMCYLWGIRHLEEDPWLKTRIDVSEHEWLLAEDANDQIWNG
ncbi:MAG: 5-deoxy-glucuronate isomerase [Firmicutes bacterium]|nr:5-deoxy-glucuronate isomerase [Bacillota bacterium]